MVTKVQKWGNSQGLRLAKHLLEEANISIGDDVEVTGKGGVIIISPVKRPREKRDLKELVSRIPRNYQAGEVDWGKQVGRETW